VYQYESVLNTDEQFFTKIAVSHKVTKPQKKMLCIFLFRAFVPSWQPFSQRSGEKIFFL